MCGCIVSYYYRFILIGSYYYVIMSPQDDSLTLLAQVTDFLTDFFMLAQACSNLQIAGTFTRTRLGFLDYSQQFSAMVAAARSALLSVEALKTHNENTNSNSKALSCETTIDFDVSSGIASLSDVSYESSYENIWSPRESCDDRFPNISGRIWNGPTTQVG